ncbi:MAG: glycosyltransferase family 4 protein [Saprospiraceae bacterium]
MPSIALLSVFRDSYVGGISVHSTNLYERLRKEGIAVKKFDYTPVTRAGGAARVRAFWRLLRGVVSARLAGTDIFHFHASNQALFFYVLGPLLKLSGAKLVLSIHSGYGYDRWLEENPRYHRLNQLTFRRLDRLLFMNRPESDRITARYPSLRDRIRTINPFIAPHPADVPPVRSQPRSPESPFRIVTLGGWKERYNVDEAVTAVLRFQQSTKASVELVVLLSTTLAEPDYQAKLTALLQKAGEQLPLTVLIDHDGVLAEMAAADLFIRPALIDSYGLCVAESLLVGTPAIATDVCTRSANAIPYRQGDLDQLVERIQAVWTDRQAGIQPTATLLQPEEDAYRSYLQLYRSL